MSIAGLLQPQKKNQLQLAPSSKSIFSCHILVGISHNRTTDQARDQNDHNKLPSTVCFFQTCCCLISIKHTENYATFFACGINTTQHNLVFQKRAYKCLPCGPTIWNITQRHVHIIIGKPTTGSICHTCKDWTKSNRERPEEGCAALRSASWR